jgi:3-hydroxyisobutyrate dehydrogenase-like beta-hydroxyacid dehydrogenase
MEVGMIGVGRMGKAMARNLLKAGHTVTLFDTTSDGPRELEKDGGKVAASARDAFRGDVCISMLPNDEAMRAVFVDGDVLPQGAKTIHMNMATASVAMAQELTALHKSRGVPYLAACVWGRPDVAAAAKLSIVVAGDSAAIDKVEPLFKAISQRHSRVGTEPVMANVAKIAGNLMVAAAIEASAEAAALVRAYGLNAAEFLTTVNTA